MPEKDKVTQPYRPVSSSQSKQGKEFREDLLYEHTIPPASLITKVKPETNLKSIVSSETEEAAITSKAATINPLTNFGDIKLEKSNLSVSSFSVLIVTIALSALSLYSYIILQPKVRILNIVNGIREPVLNIHEPLKSMEDNLKNISLYISQYKETVSTGANEDVNNYNLIGSNDSIKKEFTGLNSSIQIIQEETGKFMYHIPDSYPLSLNNFIQKSREIFSETRSLNDEISDLYNIYIQINSVDLEFNKNIRIIRESINEIAATNSATFNADPLGMIKGKITLLITKLKLLEQSTPPGFETVLSNKIQKLMTTANTVDEVKQNSAKELRYKLLDTSQRFTEDIQVIENKSREEEMAYWKDPTLISVIKDTVESYNSFLETINSYKNSNKILFFN